MEIEQMEQVTPAAQKLVRHILMLEKSPNKATIHSLARIFDKLRSSLSRIFGYAGFRSLLSRALILSRISSTWQTPLRIQVDGILEGLIERSEDESAAAERDGLLLLAHFIDLLLTFVGEEMTYVLMRDIWPAVSESDNMAVTEETPNE